MTKQEKIKDLQERLELYKGREKEMLTGGVQSYGVVIQRREPSEIEDSLSFGRQLYYHFS